MSHSVCWIAVPPGDDLYGVTKAFVSYVCCIYTTHGLTTATMLPYQRDYKWVPVHFGDRGYAKLSLLRGLVHATGESTYKVTVKPLIKVALSMAIKLLITQVYLEHGLSALLQLHLHSRLDNRLDEENGLDKGNCKTSCETLKSWHLVQFISTCTPLMAVNQHLGLRFKHNLQTHVLQVSHCAIKTQEWPLLASNSSRISWWWYLNDVMTAVI